MKDFPHGGRTYGETARLDFSTNINPLGMPEKVRDAALQGVLRSAEYPDPGNTVLTEKLSAHWGISPEMLVFGNGAAELLVRAACACPSDVTIIPIPSFYEYERSARTCGSEIRWIRLKKENGFILDSTVLSELLHAARRERAQGKTVSVLLGNPNNPTGKCIPGEILNMLLTELDQMDIRILVDESFLPFAGSGETHTVIPRLKSGRKIAALRSFTKIYGMPGLRLGVLATGDRQWRDALSDCAQPWPISLPAQLAGEAALDEKDFIDATIDLITKEREYLCREMREDLVWDLHAGPAPFVLFRAPADTAVRLKEQGILIRACKNFRGLDETWFRIGIRTHEENQELVEQWRELRCRQKRS